MMKGKAPACPEKHKAGRQNTKRKTEYGFTLVELIIAIVIGAIILIPTSFVVVESLRNTFLPEYLTIASSLLEEKIEGITNLRFDAVADQGPLSFPGNFSDYSWKAEVNYVEAEEPDTAVAEATDYKMVRISIFRPGFPEVSAATLITNN